MWANSISYFRKARLHRVRRALEDADIVRFCHLSCLVWLCPILLNLHTRKWPPWSQSVAGRWQRDWHLRLTAILVLGFAGVLVRQNTTPQLSTSTVGNKWTAMATDHATHYVFIHALLSSCGTSINDFPLQNILLLHSAPRQLLRLAYTSASNHCQHPKLFSPLSVQVFSAVSQVRLPTCPTIYSSWSMQ